MQNYIVSRFSFPRAFETRAPADGEQWRAHIDGGRYEDESRDSTTPNRGRRRRRALRTRLAPARARRRGQTRRVLLRIATRSREGARRLPLPPPLNLSSVAAASRLAAVRHASQSVFVHRVVRYAATT